MRPSSMQLLKGEQLIPMVYQLASHPIILYDIEYLDGSIETVSANVIAECVLSQVDSEGHRQLMLDDIIDHRSTADAVKINDAFYITENGLKRR